MLYMCLRFYYRVKLSLVICLGLKNVATESATAHALHSCIFIYIITSFFWMLQGQNIEPSGFRDFWHKTEVLWSLIKLLFSSLTAMGKQSIAVTTTTRLNISFQNNARAMRHSIKHCCVSLGFFVNRVYSRLDKTSISWVIHTCHYSWFF